MILEKKMKSYIAKCVNDKGKTSYKEFFQTGYWDKSVRPYIQLTQEEMDQDFVNCIIGALKDLKQEVLWIFELNDDTVVYSMNENQAQVS